MKINSLPGEMGFKALLTWDNGWHLTEGYFFSKEEVEAHAEGIKYKWPVEVWEDGSCYVAAPEELI